MAQICSNNKLLLNYRELRKDTNILVGDNHVFSDQESLDEQKGVCYSVKLRQFYILMCDPESGSLQSRSDITMI